MFCKNFTRTLSGLPRRQPVNKKWGFLFTGSGKWLIGEQKWGVFVHGVVRKGEVGG